MKRKVVLITGTSTGIGLAISQYLTEKKYIVYGTSRKANQGEVIDNVTMLRLDMDDSKSIRDAVNFVLEKEGQIDVLVNNAGTGISGAVEDTSSEESMAYFKSHVFGLMECCQAVIPQMRKQQSGKIINVSSIAGEFGLPFRGLYSASKSAVNRISETMRMELSQWDIHVSLVIPGDFKTNINANRIIPTKSASPDSLYHKAFSNQYQRISKEVSTAKDPVEIAKVINQIIASDQPKLRYKVGTFTQKIAILANRILPARIFQKILSNRYPVK